MDERSSALSAVTAVSIAAATLSAPSARAEMSAEELAKLAQNPVANLVSVPFQNNIAVNEPCHGDSDG